MSLIASATEMVHALGAGHWQVGRSHECDYPASVTALPVCTRPRIDIAGDSRQIDERVKEQMRDAISVYEVFPDVLERLRPTHILTQTQCEVCAVSLKDVEAALGLSPALSPVVVPLHPNTLSDVWDDIRRMAAALGMAERGEALVAALEARMEAVAHSARQRRSRPRVACLEWLEPLMAAGNWVPELVERAGGINLFGAAGRHSPWMQWEELVEADPDVIVLMPCGWDEERTLSELHWLADRPEWHKLRAVQAGRVHAVDGNQHFNRPGPRLVESLEILAGLFHPA